MTGSRGRPRDMAARKRIVEAGTALFLRNGYVSTTVGDVALEARVAVKTIYAAFDNKLGVLSAAHDHAVAGSAESGPVLEQDWVQEMKHAESVESALTSALAHLAMSTARTAPILTVIQTAAADQGVAELLSDLRKQRHTFSLRLTDILLSLPGAVPRAATGRIADVLYATMAAESYTLFVTECGWTTKRWQDWARDTVARELTTAPADSRISC